MDHDREELNDASGRERRNVMVASLGSGHSCRYMNLGYEASSSERHLTLGRGDYEIVGTWVSAEIGSMECEANSRVDGRSTA